MCSVLPLLPNLFACSSEEGDTAKVSHLCLPLQRDGSPVGQQVSFCSDTRFGHMAETCPPNVGNSLQGILSLAFCFSSAALPY